ncbi:MAG TPA: hypothetical protein VJA47_04920 [archaeon]|nr:hypothetical protein [archaeon]
MNRETALNGELITTVFFIENLWADICQSSQKRFQNISKQNFRDD